MLDFERKEIEEAIEEAVKPLRERVEELSEIIERLDRLEDLEKGTRERVDRHVEKGVLDGYVR